MSMHLWALFPVLACAAPASTSDCTSWATPLILLLCTAPSALLFAAAARRCATAGAEARGFPEPHAVVVSPGGPEEAVGAQRQAWARARVAAMRAAVALAGGLGQASSLWMLLVPPALGRTSLDNGLSPLAIVSFGWLSCSPYDRESEALIAWVLPYMYVAGMVFAGVVGMVALSLVDSFAQLCDGGERVATVLPRAPRRIVVCDACHEVLAALSIVLLVASTRVVSGTSRAIGTLLGHGGFLRNPGRCLVCVILMLANVALLVGLPLVFAFKAASQREAKWNDLFANESFFYRKSAVNAYAVIPRDWWVPVQLVSNTAIALSLELGNLIGSERSLWLAQLAATILMVGEIMLLLQAPLVNTVLSQVTTRLRVSLLIAWFLHTSFEAILPKVAYACQSGWAWPPLFIFACLCAMQSLTCIRIRAQQQSSVKRATPACCLVHSPSSPRDSLCVPFASTIAQSALMFVFMSMEDLTAVFEKFSKDEHECIGVAADFITHGLLGEAQEVESEKFNMIACSHSYGDSVGTARLALPVTQSEGDHAHGMQMDSLGVLLQKSLWTYFVRARHSLHNHAAHAVSASMTEHFPDQCERSSIDQASVACTRNREAAALPVHDTSPLDSSCPGLDDSVLCEREGPSVSSSSSSHMASDHRDACRWAAGVEQQSPTATMTSAQKRVVRKPSPSGPLETILRGGHVIDGTDRGEAIERLKRRNSLSKKLLTELPTIASSRSMNINNPPHDVRSSMEDMITSREVVVTNAPFASSDGVRLPIVVAEAPTAVVSGLQGVDGVPVLSPAYLTLADFSSKGSLLRIAATLSETRAVAGSTLQGSPRSFSSGDRPSSGVNYPCESDGSEASIDSHGMSSTSSKCTHELLTSALGDHGSEKSSRRGSKQSANLRRKPYRGSQSADMSPRLRTAANEHGDCDSLNSEDALQRIYAVTESKRASRRSESNAPSVTVRRKERSLDALDNQWKAWQSRRESMKKARGNGRTVYGEWLRTTATPKPML